MSFAIKGGGSLEYNHIFSIFLKYIWNYSDSQNAFCTEFGIFIQHI